MALMHKVTKLGLLLCIAVINQISHARVGCIDNSFHLKKWPDFKQYHYVQCSCPCKEFAHVAGRDTCLKCGHYHAPLPKIHITKNPSIHFASQNSPRLRVKLTSTLKLRRTRRRAPQGDRREYDK